jgi:hypothetical protein
MGFREHMAGHAREAAYYNKDSRQYKSVMLPASFGSAHAPDGLVPCATTRIAFSLPLRSQVVVLLPR